MKFRLADGDLNIVAELTGEVLTEFDADQVKYLIIDPVPDAPTWRNRITLHCRPSGQMSNFREQILAMSPERYARAAKRAATLAKELADKAGIPISPRMQHLVDCTEAELADERRRRP